MENNNYALEATEAKRLGIDPTPIIGGLQDYHVICGRGSGGNQRKANEEYRALVETFRPRYLAAPEEAKEGITWETLRAVANQGMEIVKKYDPTGEWHRVTSKKAYVKIQQYLRDGRPQDQRKTVAKKGTKKSPTKKRAPKVKASYAPMNKRPLVNAMKSAERPVMEPIPLEDAHNYCSVDLSLLRNFSLFRSCDSKASLSADVDEAAPQDLWQQIEEFDWSVIKVALYNYESFYKLEHGTATFEMVSATSAGIQGWAASLLLEDGSPNNADQPPQEAKDVAAVAVETAEPSKRRQKSKGDEEEARQLRIALLESIGAHPAHLNNASFEYDDDGDDYDCGDRQFDYDDDDSTSCYCKEEWSNQMAEDDNTESQSETNAKATPEATNRAPATEAKNVDNDTENATTTGQRSADIAAEVDEQNKRGPQTVMRSSWQFQAMMDASSVRPSKDDLISSDCVDPAVPQHMLQLHEIEAQAISNDDLDPADELLLELTAKLEH